jgi:hypothetical protein
MIGSFRDSWLELFFVEDSSSARIPPDLESRLFRKLQMLDDAASERDLRVPISAGGWFFGGPTTLRSRSISMITAIGEVDYVADDT